MVETPDLLDEFEKSLIRAQSANYRRNLRIVEELYREACRLGVWPPKDPLEGIEVDIHVARVINARLEPPK